MDYKKTPYIKIILFCLISLLLSACVVNKSIEASSPSKKTKPSKLDYAGEQHAVTELSNSGNYRFTLYSELVPIPFKKIHHWILKVENKEGEPVTNARLYVHGGMPAHRHGFPTKPVAKKHLGNGEYRVEGIKFTMPGYWEMRFTMKVGNQSERVTFNINLY